MNLFSFPRFFLRVKCTSSATLEALTLGLDGCASFLLVVAAPAGRLAARCSRLTARRGGGALARTRRLLIAPAGRAFAHAHGGTSTQEPVPIWRCLLEPQLCSSGFPLPTAAARAKPLEATQKRVVRRAWGEPSGFRGFVGSARRL